MISTAPPPLWPHQTVAISQIILAIEAGELALCVSCPTGGGKTLIIRELLKWRPKALILNDRKLVRSQTSDVLSGFGVTHGVMASGEAPALLRATQVGMVQTIKNRMESGQWELPDVELAIVDEAHRHTSPTSLKIIDEYKARGVPVVGFTATPVGLAGVYDRLLNIATNSELRACGALVPAVTYAPDEPDLSKIKRVDGDEFTEPSLRPYFDPLQIFGRVVDNLRLLNPDMKPTLLFANSVPASRYFAEHLTKNGISAAHIDAETPDNEREDIRNGSSQGDIQVVCNRFVLREGIDWPWIGHGIFATAFGALSNFLQSGGRLLRSHGTIQGITVQDHGGNWHRHGSLNQDRHWTLEDTDKTIAKACKKRRQEGEEKEPIRCPRCGHPRHTGAVCPMCGHKHKRSVRIVIQTDGTLIKMVGDVTKKKKKTSDEQKLWSSCYFRMKNARGPRTYSQVAALYRRESGRDPPAGLQFMPTNDVDWDRRIGAKA